jgi:hypothetical protein
MATSVVLSLVDVALNVRQENLDIVSTLQLF